MLYGKKVVMIFPGRLGVRVGVGGMWEVGSSRFQVWIQCRQGPKSGPLLVPTQGNCYTFKGLVNGLKTPHGGQRCINHVARQTPSSIKYVLG